MTICESERSVYPELNAAIMSGQPRCNYRRHVPDVGGVCGRQCGMTGWRWWEWIHRAAQPTCWVRAPECCSSSNSYSVTDFNLTQLLTHLDNLNEKAPSVLNILCFVHHIMVEVLCFYSKKHLRNMMHSLSPTKPHSGQKLDITESTTGSWIINNVLTFDTMKA